MNLDTTAIGGNIKKTKTLRTAIVVVWFAVALALLLMPDTISARSGGNDDRVRFYGIVELMPDDGFHGTWVIGGRTVTTHPGTQFDQLDGPLKVDGCAKVDIRNGRVYEIDSEPLQNCR